MPNPDIVLFDFDGTLADTLSVSLKVANELAPKYGYREIAKSELLELRNKSIPALIGELGVPPLKVPIIITDMRTRLRQYMHDTQCFPGIPEVVSMLYQRQCKLGIITSNSRENVTVFLHTQKVVEQFAYLHAVSNIFGKSKALRSFLKKNKVDNDRVIYVGDETRDVEAARKCNIKVVAVSWGYNSRTALSEHKPDALVSDPEQLYDAICSLS